MTVAKTKITFARWLRACVVVCLTLGIAMLLFTLCFMAATADDGYRDIGVYQRQTSEASICQTQISSLLSQAVISDLCRRNLVPPDLARCDAINIQLQRKDIFGIFEAATTVGKSTYSKVKLDFGRYKRQCSKVNPFGNYYTCIYDLNGNGPYIEIFYDAVTHHVQTISRLYGECF